MNVVAVVLLAVGILVYGLAWSGEQNRSFRITGVGLLLAVVTTLILTLALMLIHEGIHGLAIVCSGGTARFGVTMIARVMPAFYCTAPEKRFTRTQYIAIGLAPLLTLGVGCGIAVALAPFGGWLVLPSAVHLSGCAGDIAMVWVAARQPRGTTIEDLQTGVRFWN
jgi:hypothetical protein